MGRDTLTGGARADHFVFNTALNASNIDAITDFTHAADKIVLDDDIFTQIGAIGALNAAAFRKGAGVATAGDADDRIILNTTTGALFYDADGNGARRSCAVRHADRNQRHRHGDRVGLPGGGVAPAFSIHRLT